MGIFDVLGVASNSSTGGNPPADDSSTIVVTDTSTLVEPVLPLDTNQTSTPPQVDAFLNMSAGDITPEMPSYTERKAMEQNVSSPFTSENVSEDASSILINNNSSSMNDSTTASHNVIDETANIPLVQENPEIAVSEDASSILFSETPEVESAVTEQADEQMKEDSVFDAFGIIENPEPDLPKNEEIFPATEEKSEQPEEIFSFETNETEGLEEIPVKNEALPASTLDFLTAGLAQLDAMEKSLQDKKQAFLDQAEEYRTEKEKFAELEKNALADSRSMDDEHDRIVTMRKYFETQQNKQTETKEVTESVKTALTGISVQNAVDTAMKSKSRARKAIAA